MSESDLQPEEPAHDVLAAEAFAVPAPDPALQPHEVVLPDDPSGIAEPHDVLAAEEFAMPVGRVRAALSRPAQSPGRTSIWVGAIALALIALLLRRR